jgi:PPOX class probable F420-dependent enzyme
MTAMTDDQIRQFLTARPARTAKLATTRADGRPHVAPVWYAVDDDGSVVLTTGARTVKGRNLRRDPRVAICVDEDRPPFSFVIIEGTATLDEDVGHMRPWAEIIAGRYMGDDQAEAYGARNAVPGELLVRIRPDRVNAQKDIAD